MNTKKEVMADLKKLDKKIAQAKKTLNKIDEVVKEMENTMLKKRIILGEILMYEAKEKINND